MKIAFDCDGVIANLQMEAVYRIKRDFGLELPLEQWRTHRFAEVFEEISEEWVDEQLADPTFWMNCVPYEPAWFMVNKWFMDGHDIFIVTARGDDNCPGLNNITERWFDEWQINYNYIYSDLTPYEKHIKCLEIEADILIEDNPKEVEACSKHLTSYLLEHPYNFGYPIGSGIRVPSLYDLDKVVSASV